MRVSPGEDAHLRGGAHLGSSSGPIGHEAHGVAEALGDELGPGLELVAGPLEAVVLVAEAPSGQVSKRTL